MDSIPHPETDAAVRPLVAGDLIPDFDLAASLGRRVTRDGLRGRPFVLYLYPKADTSGCTRQACDFEQALSGLGAAGRAVGLPVIGVSKDPIGAIDRFAAKYSLTFPLASDPAGSLIEACGAWVAKSMYGRSYMGIDRSTFLVDADGRIVRVWRKVKVPGHAALVMNEAA